MLYRSFKVITTGQFLDTLFTVDSGSFSVSAQSHQEDIAAALGLLPVDLEVVEAALDPRSGTLLELPVTADDPLSVSRTRIAELLAIPRSSWTASEQRELVQLTAQETMKQPQTG